MKYIEAPEEYTLNSTLFLAGGITGCPDWQSHMVSLLRDEDLTIFNPRRDHFDVNKKDESEKQIKWEAKHLEMADMISFWFPSETLCPIVLYELGAWSMTDKKIFVGVHPDYKRRHDVLVQTKLKRPDVQIVYSVVGLSNQIKKDLRGSEYIG